MFNTGSIAPAEGYLEAVRRACDAHGVVLIFDEVISGFRVALVFILKQRRFDVRPAKYTTFGASGRATAMSRSVSVSRSNRGNFDELEATPGGSDDLVEDVDP